MAELQQGMDIFLLQVACVAISCQARLDGRRAMERSIVFQAIGASIFMAAVLINAEVLAAPEITTPDSPFTLGSPTAATIKPSYSPVIGDNGSTIYNLFGALNAGVEDSGDIIFGDRNSQPNTVEFTTPTQVKLIGLAVYLDSDDGTLNGPRSVGTFTFTADGAEEVNATPVNESIAVNSGLNVFMFANLVTASTFVATFSTNPHLNFVPDENDDGVGPRVYELDGIVPEPIFLTPFAIGPLILLTRPRRRLHTMPVAG
jgi:hypothetical protein